MKKRLERICMHFLRDVARKILRISLDFRGFPLGLDIFLCVLGFYNRSEFIRGGFDGVLNPDTSFKCTHASYSLLLTEHENNCWQLTTFLFDCERPRSSPVFRSDSSVLIFLATVLMASIQSSLQQDNNAA